jgi:hypothetical protein
MEKAREETGEMSNGKVWKEEQRGKRKEKEEN